jgi:hypothetical protein
MLAAAALLQLACYKDKGNYDYHPAVAPGIENLDSVYNVEVGDTLVIKPIFKTTDPNSRFGFTWRLGMPKQLRDTTFTGPVFTYWFKLDPDAYPLHLTITDSSNGMKYFRDITLNGITPFSIGTAVLSLEGNTSQLSFVQPDSTVFSRIYKTLNKADLPGNPKQIINLVKQQVSPVPDLGYWITNDDPTDGGTHIGNNTLLKKNTLLTNFFNSPPTVKPGYFETTENGVLRGVLNGKVYEGAWQTYYGADIYGYFGEPVNGDYEAYPRVVFNQGLPVVMGYDINRKQFFAVTNFGMLSYLGTNYTVTDVTQFDPKNAQLDLLFFHMIGAGDCYAFGTAADGTLYVLKFATAYKGFVEITPVFKKVFPQPALINSTTKWVGAAANGEIFYFTSGDKVYSYTPANQQVTALTTNFGGKNVTMLKLIDDDHTLIAGVDGEIYFLDVNTGKFGDVLKRYTGIPGTPVDVSVRN